MAVLFQIIRRCHRYAAYFHRRCFVQWETMTCAACVMAGRWKVESLAKCRELGESLHCLRHISHFCGSLATHCWVFHPLYTCWSHLVSQVLLRWAMELVN